MLHGCMERGMPTKQEPLSDPHARLRRYGIARLREWRRSVLKFSFRMPPPALSV